MIDSPIITNAIRDLLIEHVLDNNIDARGAYFSFTNTDCIQINFPYAIIFTKEILQLFQIIATVMV